jgi:copper(I)-binding protein
MRSTAEDISANRSVGAGGGDIRTDRHLLDGEHGRPRSARRRRDLPQRQCFPGRQSDQTNIEPITAAVRFATGDLCQREVQVAEGLRPQEQGALPPAPRQFFLSGNGKPIMKKVSLILTCAAVLSALLVAPVRAEDVKAGDLVISQAWSRATPNGAKIAGGYLAIENKGTLPDRLVGGAAEIAGKLEIHEMAMNNGVMTMRPLDKGLVIEPGKTVKLAPGGYHLMIMDLKGPLKQGDKVPLTLEFEKAGKATLSLEVQGVGAQAPAGSDHSGGAMEMKKPGDHSGMKM